uniref:Ig-like domain-containing protein n=1 Tax=Callorhinchus milii TaxID=7868 RepID=A0A4W3H1V6_CALMI
TEETFFLAMFWPMNPSVKFDYSLHIYLWYIASLTLVCETGEFYPGDVTLTWNKDGSEVKTGIHFMKENNSKGLYKVSSSLEEPKTVQSGVVYTCLVTHVTLQTPAVAVYNAAKSKGNLLKTIVN